MSAAALILRIVIATIAVIAVGTIGVFGFVVLEPFHSQFGNPPASLGWGDPGGTTLAFASFSVLGLLVVLVLWFVYAPIREDRRQQWR